MDIVNKYSALTDRLVGTPEILKKLEETLFNNGPANGRLIDKTPANDQLRTQIPLLKAALFETEALEMDADILKLVKEYLQTYAPRTPHPAPRTPHPATRNPQPATRRISPDRLGAEMLAVVISRPNCARQLKHRDIRRAHRLPGNPGIAFMIAFTDRMIDVYPNWEKGRCAPSDTVTIHLERGDLLFFDAALVHNGCPWPKCSHLTESAADTSARARRRAPTTRCNNPECCSVAVHGYCPALLGSVAPGKFLSTEFVRDDGSIIDAKPGR